MMDSVTARRRKRSVLKLLRWLIGILFVLAAVLYAGRFLESSQLPVVQPSANNKGDAVVLLDVPYIPQNPDFPTGCEAVSAVMALRYCGHAVSPDRFIDEYLRCDSNFYTRNGTLYGPDPWSVFVGDPRKSDSYGCYAPVILDAIETYTPGGATDTTGCTLEELCVQYTDRSVPVLIWASSGMRETRLTRSWQLDDGRSFTWIAGEHCLVLVGYDASNYYLNDPQVGAAIPYRRSLVEKRYSELGMQSLAVTG